MYTLLFGTILLVAGQDYQDRKPHPLAPSLPLLTKDEYAKIDTIVDRFIQADVGKLKGAEAKRAIDDFNKLGPEAIFNLIDGLNRAANMESSCPAVIIGRKIAKVVASTEDTKLLAFAKENIGAGVTAKRHVNTLEDLKFGILLRKNALARRPAAEKAPTKLDTLSLSDLEKSAAKERGAPLKAILTESEKRNGQKAVDILIQGIANTDSSIAKLSQGLLAKNLSHQNTDVLKAMLKHDRRDVKIAAAQAVGGKKLPFGAELIVLLQDRDDDVRQAGRRALVQISGGVDHEWNVERWREWLSKQR